jgi:hypothetical protein
MNVTCPHCGKLVKVKRRDLGQNAVCGGCHTFFTVPDVSNPLTDDELFGWRIAEIFGGLVLMSLFVSCARGTAPFWVWPIAFVAAFLIRVGWQKISPQ